MVLLSSRGSCRGVPACAAVLHLLAPAPPERTHLLLILGPRIPAHAARDVGPSQLLERAEADLAALQRFDVIGRRETARPKKGQKIVQPQAAPSRSFAPGSERPRRDLHVT